MATDAPTAPKPKKKKAADEEDEGDDEFTTVGKGGKSYQFTPETILKNLQAVQEARGKKVCMHIGRTLHMLIMCVEHGSSGANTYLGETARSRSNAVPTTSRSSSSYLCAFRLQLLRLLVYAGGNVDLCAEGGRSPRRYPGSQSEVCCSGDNRRLR